MRNWIFDHLMGIAFVILLVWFTYCVAYIQTNGFS